jgi:hypothetical protein
VAAHVLPGSVAWAVLGLSLGLFKYGRTALYLTIAYAFVFGFGEAFTMRVRTPSSPWQVPARWLLGRAEWARVGIWGLALGPGLLTRNPYAGMWLPLLILCIPGSPRMGLLLGLSVGSTHGLARSIGILLGGQTRSPWSVVSEQLRWRTVDGLFLLFSGTALAVLALSESFASGLLPEIR